MSEFRQLTDDFWASPQITPEDVADAASRGIAMIINNRPEGEAEDQPSGTSIEDAAASAGLAYHAIPVSPGGFNEVQVEAMTKALDQAEGPVLAFCRSGTRSTLLWSLAMASQGSSPEGLSASAAKAGYDLAPVRLLLDQLSARQPD